jgi:hypothetical protein
MPEITATAIVGVVLTGLFFSLGTATVYQANKTVAPSTGYGTSTNTAAPKDYPNIVFGSLFLFFAIVLAYYTGRAILSV